MRRSRAPMLESGFTLRSKGILKLLASLACHPFSRTNLASFVSLLYTAQSKSSAKRDRGKGDASVISQWSADGELMRLERTVPGSPVSVQGSLDAAAETQTRQTVRGLEAGNISSLHHQAFKGRKICIKERVDLHLVWYYGRIFIKPIPKCLFSRTFRETYLPHAKDFDGGDLAPEASGFLKSYAMLIVHESDFDLAKELRLLPKLIDWVSWCHFIQESQHLRAKHVGQRYHYGEIRLTRLNSFSNLVYGSSYQEVQYNYATYFARFGRRIGLFLTDLAAYDDGGMYRGIAVKFVLFTCVLTIAGLLLSPLLCIFFQLKEAFLYNYRYREMS
ncbi:hypothetical protein EDB81DRAFT_859257 [Dactylonectria macrodidyma]|uniref:Uncharacterized protein n=1 Tax=Dactylonectria macrodidyma TaxID=307937 RepID=A0A9P9EAQ3_9HYPO|nr:hypothetical protein EDB81DRAFT_859257 [Dactylonectria macrodidyma]